MGVKETLRRITYRFRWDGKERDFIVSLKSPSMRLQLPPRESYPEWTRLENQQCGNCPLKPADSPHCPAAVSLIDLLDRFKDCLSTERAEVVIITDEREYHSTMEIQEGLSSLMGLYMATAGCPILDRMRPMVFTHLPFSTLRETVYRVLSMYLIAQFFRRKRGAEPDWELSQFKKMQEEIAEVNRAFAERLRTIASEDASLNALVKLDCLASYSSYSIEKNLVDSLEPMFTAFLTEEGRPLPVNVSAEPK